MTAQERMKRPQLSREGPRRTFVQHEHLGARPAKAAMDESIEEAVRIGYRVINEQIRQGQDAASCQNGRPRQSSVLQTDIQVMIDSFARFAKDATAIWANILANAANNCERSPPSNTCEPPPPPTTSDRSNSISVEVNSARPVRVTLDLSANLVSFMPMIGALQPLVHGGPALTDVKFALSADNARGILAITVPNDLAAGVYTAVILDRRTHQAGGTLHVHIHPDN